MYTVACTLSDIRLLSNFFNLNKILLKVLFFIFFGAEIIIQQRDAKPEKVLQYDTEE